VDDKRRRRANRGAAGAPRGCGECVRGLERGQCPLPGKLLNFDLQMTHFGGVGEADS